MAPSGRRRHSAFVLIISLLFLFTSTACAASAVLGIDLGTEYLKAVLVKPGIPLEIVLTKDSKRKETAGLAFKPSNTKSQNPDFFPERVYGGDAIALAARFPGDVYSNLKPLLGRVAKDSAVEEYKSRHPGQRVIEDKLRGTVAFRSGSFGREVDPFSVEELLAMELRNLRGNAEALAGKDSTVQDAVITIPPYYTAEERRAVELAADLAGLRVLALISDGLAVGLNYATSRIFPSVNEGGSPEFHLVYDMGAGSARATILRFQGRTVKDVGKFNKTIQEVNIMGVGWDRQLGGDALNAVIVNDMVSQFVETKKIKAMGTTAEHVREHGRTMAKLWKEAERLRQVLSANTETSASFEGLFYEDVNFKYKLSRANFEELASAYADRVPGPIRKALAAAKLTIADLESVILHGGAVRTPFVQKQLEATAGDPSKLRTNVNADEAAVFGAAFKAAGLSPSFRVKDIRAGDSAGYTVGWSIENKDRNQMLFTPLSQIGAEKQVPFRNVEDFAFTLYQEISDQASREGAKRPILKVQTENLTASVAQLTEKFGCAAADISTKFSIRLSPIDGLPEVTEGSVSCETEASEKKGGVVDGVKGFFGLGSKKGDQEPLQEGSETQSATPASSVKPSTTSSPAESQTPNPEENFGQETKQTKRRIETIHLDFSTEPQGIPSVSKSELKRIKDRLAAFDASDKSRLLREEAFNTLEAYTYRARDLLTDDSFIGASTDELRKEIEEKFRSASEWLYGAGADANREDLKARLRELRSLVDPVQKRMHEAVKRPEQIRLLKEALDQTRTLIEVVKEQIKNAASASSISSPSSSPETQTTTAPSSNGDDFADLDDEPSNTSTSTQAPKIPEMPLYSAEDLEVLTKSHETIHRWLTTKLAEQEKLAPYKDPVMLSADMEAKSKQLNRVIMELLQKKIRMPPKPKASSKPKPAKKNKKSKTTSANKETPTGSEEVPNITVRKDGEMPTEEEIIEMIEKRKAKEKGDSHDEL